MFYEFNQNNSGGSFVFDGDAGITHFVIIEAESVEAACERAEGIGIYFDGCDDGRDCPCCGDRWYRPWSNEGDSEPMLYDTPLSEYVVDFPFFLWMAPNPEVFVHYADGRVEGFTPPVKGE